MGTGSGLAWDYRLDLAAQGDKRAEMACLYTLVVS